MIELVWDAARLGTATAPSGASATVGEQGSFSPEDLIAMATAACLMRTFLRLADQAHIPILSYAATAHANISAPAGAPHVAVHAYVVAPSCDDERDLMELSAESARLSPVAQLLGDRITIASDVRVLCGAEPARR
jgi:organic hydroperoxide reductase OsmC/OhrA